MNLQKRCLAIIAALSLCGSGSHSMQSIKDVHGLYYPALMGAGSILFLWAGNHLYSNMYRNKYSLTYNKKESIKDGVDESVLGVIFDNIKLKKGHDEFTFSGTIWEYNMHQDAVGKVIKSELADPVALLLREGKSVLVKLSDKKTAHFSSKNYTDKEVMNGILELLLRVDDEIHLKFFQ